MTTLRQHATQILHLRESPRRTALAFALGVGIAFSPPYGLHTIMVFVCAWLFRLNFVALFGGALVNNPWTLAPILGLTFWTGFAITDQPPVAFDWTALTLANFYDQVAPYLASFIAGGLALSALFGLLSYPLAYLAIRRYRARMKLSTMPESPLRPPGELS